MASINEYQSLIRQLTQEKTRLEVEYSSIQSRIKESLQLLKDMGFSSVQEAQAKQEQYRTELDASYRNISSLLTEIKNFNFKQEEKPISTPVKTDNSKQDIDFGDLDSLFNI